MLIGSSAPTETWRKLPFSAGGDSDGAILGELVSFTSIVERYVGATLGSAPLYEGSILVVSCVGKGSIGPIFFNCVARSCRACHTGSPALREGMVGDGGCVSKWIISDVAWCKYSVVLVFGIGIVFDKKVTVSQTRSAFVFGK